MPLPQLTVLKEIIIKIDNQAVFLNPNLAIPIRQTDIPAEHMTFRSREEIFWKVELLEYNAENKCWKVRITDYCIKDTQNFSRQQSTREVLRLSFESFDWQKLEPLLSSYHKIKLLDVLKNHETERLLKEKTTGVPAYAMPGAGTPSQSPGDKLTDSPADPRLLTRTYEVELSVYFSETQFMLGYLAFTKYVKEVDDTVAFKIPNDFILPEFENIKSWFARKLKSRKFRVNATITTTGGEVTSVTATAPQIAMINEALVDSIKYQRTLALTKSPKLPDIDKSLFTAEDIFNTGESDDVEGNVFRQDEKDILQFLITHHNTRNKKQLEYLSGHKQSANFRIRFTLHPNFGFLFLIEGMENNHFVWELLNTHATYIWSIGKSERDIELQYRRVEDIINTIRNTGREQYKRAYKNNHHDSDLIFCSIEHDDITSSFVDGFVKWKHKLNEKLI